MDELIQKLKQQREILNAAKYTASNALETIKSSDPTYVENTEIANEAMQQITELESAIRAAALAEYAANGNKKPHNNVQVKIYKVFSVNDSARVLSWVKTNLADALIYDEKKVKNYAEKIGPVDGTSINEEPKVQIDTKL